jgi:hypothetical protein
MDRETILSLINGRGGAQDWFRLFKCHHNVWGPWLCLENKHMFTEVMKPRGKCFFFEYLDGMGMPVAVELERRAAAQREAEKDRALTRRAFWVAFAALLVSIAATIANIIVQIVK